MITFSFVGEDILFCRSGCKLALLSQGVLTRSSLGDSIGLTICGVSSPACSKKELKSTVLDLHAFVKGSNCRFMIGDGKTDW